MTTTYGDGIFVVGELIRTLAVMILLTTIIRRRSCSGISARSQILVATSYIIRYPNMWTVFYSFGNMIRIITSTLMFTTAFLIYFGFHKTYQRKKDAFVTELLLIPSFLLSLWINYDHTPLGIAKAFSIYIESVAILPQFYLIFEQRRLKKCIIPYLVAMGFYKMAFIIHWIILYQTQGLFDPIEASAGILYTIIFLLSFAEIIFLKVKVSGQYPRQNFFKNIFLINTNEPLTDRLNLVSDDSVETEKSDPDLSPEALPAERV